LRDDVHHHHKRFHHRDDDDCDDETHVSKGENTFFATFRVTLTVVSY
jgi:hypothetical protein